MIEVAMSSDTMLLRSAANAIRHSLPNPSIPVHGFESLSWEDLPIMIQQTEHPSFSRRNQQQENRQPPSASSSVPRTVATAAGAVVGAACQSLNTFKPKACELSLVKPQSFTTFGWGDFPIGADEGSASSKAVKPLLPQASMTHNLQPFKRQRDQTQRATVAAIKVSPYMNDAIVSSVPSSSDAKTSRCVQFSTVHVREYSISLGDHPLCFSYPMSLDWSHGDEKVVPIEEYEEQRQTRTGAYSRMDVLERRSNLAENMGLTLGQMDALERERIQRTRGTLELHRTKSCLASVQPNAENYLKMSIHIGDCVRPVLDSHLIVR